MSRAHPEQDLHIAIAKFLDIALPKDAWWTTIPAGGGGKVRGAILKAMGYRPGTPDILIIWRHRTNLEDIPPDFVIWFEVKDAKGALRDNQENCRDILLKNGCKWGLVKSVEDVERALLRFRVPLRATIT